MKQVTEKELSVEELGEIIKASRPGSAQSVAAIAQLSETISELRVSFLKQAMLTAKQESERKQSEVEQKK